MRSEGVEPEKVMAAMEELREEGFNGIAMTPSEDQLLKARINQYSEEYGIPVVTFNADLEDTKRLCFVGQDTFQSGRAAAGLMNEMTGGKGQVVIISGQVANPGLISRQKGFTTEIKDSFPGLRSLIYDILMMMSGIVPRSWKNFWRFIRNLPVFISRVMV